VATGTPYFVARQLPCEMCEDIPCVKACPTGALDHSLTDINKAKMGLAVLVDQENCLNFLGLRCDICYRVCPVIDKAITLEQQLNARTGKHALFIPVHSDACTGCGKCEKACPLEVAAIKVYPTELAKGEPGKHYRFGWVEKEKAGGSLVAPDLEHQYNLPEGMRYESGKGCLPGAEPRRHACRTRSAAGYAPRPARGQTVSAGASEPKRWPPRAGCARTNGCCCGASRNRHPALFLLGPLAGVWIVKGNLSLQLHAGCPAAHRSLRAAAVAADAAPAGDQGLRRRRHRAGLLPAPRRPRLLLLGLPGEHGHRRAPGCAGGSASRAARTSRARRATGSSP
jgi:Fe-S-cluster-containing hydrogenase component 2